MNKTIAGILAAVASAIPSQVSAGVCETASKYAAIGSGLVASASSTASLAGYAAVTHSSGAWIISSVGVGGTGYIAGTYGVVGAGLATVGLPVVIGSAAVLGTGAATIGGFCYAKRKGLIG